VTSPTTPPPPFAPPPVVVAPPPVAVTPPPAVVPKGPRKPVFGWIGFALILLAAISAGVITAYAYLETVDAFIQGPPWWALTSQLAALPVGLLCFLGLVFGIVGTARREKPGWPAITAMIFSLPGFGYVAFAAYVWFTVTAACASPPGACGI
jgi:hypothetical protein